uniref:Aminotransferase-like plant mobile domain-containing protein n=1 Tax=Hordeum vulgare subsp. vulgare TaxID=112509 RepID=A0A8I6YJU6_HORVV
MDLLQRVLNFKGTPPWLNATALTALTDHWRPEMHSFHLPLGEMSVTLEDITMITGLPIEGRALTGKRYFRKCSNDASPTVVERYARAYLWNLLTQVVFLNGTGDTTSWMFLDPLCVWDVKWSWGSAALAFLYRQLDGACMRSKPTSTLGGFVWALQVWMWERIPVGRNLSLPPEEPWKYPFDGDEERYPTIAHTWANAQWTSIAPMGRYKAYISELDMLTYEQDNWRPYTILRRFPLRNMCLRDQHLWRVWCPMVCFFAVEWHLPYRVSMQFGVQQRSPPDHVETSVVLHKTNRQNNKSVINWEEHHIMWVDMWNAQRNTRVETDQTPDSDKAAYLRHLEWMRKEYKIIHKGARHDGVHT